MALALDSSGNALQALRPGFTHTVGVGAVSAVSATAMGGTQAATGVSDPRQIDGLTMWLESFDAASLVLREAGNDTFVEAWLDKSGKGNNAVQGTAAQQLRLIADGLAPGRASVQGGGASDTHMDIPPLLTDLAAQAFTAVGVGKTDVVGTTQRFYGFQEAVGSNTNAYTRFATDNRLEHQVRVSSGVNFSVKSVGVAADGAYHVWCARLNAAPGLLEVALDDEAFQVTDAGGAFAPAMSMTAAPMIFAGDFSGNPLQEMQGHVPAMAFFDRALSDSEWAALRDGYLTPLIDGGSVVRDVEVVRVAATADCYIAVGESPVATTSDVFLPAGVPEYFTVNKGVDKIAAIRASVDGVLSITEMQ